ncbi:hypothetical protein [Niallia oryzisoli]
MKAREDETGTAKVESTEGTIRALKLYIHLCLYVLGHLSIST